MTRRLPLPPDPAAGLRRALPLALLLAAALWLLLAGAVGLWWVLK